MHRIPLILALVLTTASLAAAQTTQPLLSMAIAPDGAVSLNLGPKLAANGRWRLMDPIGVAQQGEMVAGNCVSSTVTLDSPTHATMVDHYSAARIKYEMSLQQEDLHISMHVENLDPARELVFINFAGITFHFSSVPIGVLHSSSYVTLLRVGPSMFHPSRITPLGAAFVRDDDFGFSVYSPSEFDHVSLFDAMGTDDKPIPTQCEPHFLSPVHLPAGKAVDMDVVFRVSADRSMPHLLGGYKKLYDEHFPSMYFKPDTRAVAAFADSGAGFVSRSNPFGFNGAFRRLDSDAGTRAYIRAVAPAIKRAGMLGIIFWSPGGYDPPMYPPDFDQFPAAVAQNIPTLVDGLKNKFGLHVGLCARCGDGVIRQPGKDPVVYRLSSTNAEQMQTMVNRFHHAMDMGFDLFYLDSFGAESPDDIEILKKVRATVGPDVQLYTETGSDLTLPYAGRYCEWETNGVLGIDFQTYAALRYLRPQSPWLCIDRTHQRTLANYIRAGLTPLITDMQAARMPASQPATRP
jgi:hypothetical protein